VTKRAAHYTPRIGKMICAEIAQGATLLEALEKVGYLAPSISTCWRWLDEHQDFRESMDRARLLQADMQADELIKISRDVVKQPSLATAYRVACDILKWQAEKRNPAKYAPKDTDSKSKKVLNQQEIKAEIKRLESELGIEKPDDKPKVFSIMKPRKA
jgi:hypothetical protein